ncbi:MAG: DUF951 domain-containing protein [Clostridia bacterium]|nr:DUF951 domain-containing protein [Clostridia bacterium]
MLVHIGDVVKTRKPHPCKNDLWRITYVGSDIKMKCENCGRIVMLDRIVFEKRVKKIVESAVHEEE